MVASPRSTDASIPSTPVSMPWTDVSMPRTAVSRPWMQVSVRKSAASNGRSSQSMRSWIALPEFSNDKFDTHNRVLHEHHERLQDLEDATGLTPGRQA